MRLSGLQKLTLLDYPGKVACTVFTDGCNFRCPYCHNASLVLSERKKYWISENELFDFLQSRRRLLDGVVVTGGEPLLHEDLPELLKKIHALGFCIKLDTNGSMPERLKQIVRSGLADRVAMDIKNAPELYAETVGSDRVNMSAICESKDFLLSGEIEYEFRTTVAQGLHTRESLVSAAKWIAGARKYYLQQYKDSGDLIKPEGLCAFDESQMCALAEAVRPYVPSVRLRGV